MRKFLENFYQYIVHLNWLTCMQTKYFVTRDAVAYKIMQSDNFWHLHSYLAIYFGTWQNDRPDRTDRTGVNSQQLAIQFANRHAPFNCVTYFNLINWQLTLCQLHKLTNASWRMYWKLHTIATATHCVYVTNTNTALCWHQTLSLRYLNTLIATWPNRERKRVYCHKL